MPLSCVIIDDEYLALRILQQYIEQMPSLHLLAQFTHPRKALDYLETKKADLVLLDIQMPGIDGLGFIRQLSYQPLVIFTTAREDYALDAYELGVIDYLVKPIAPARFEKAIQKALQYHSAQPPVSEEKPAPSYLPIKSGYQWINIPFDQIVYIEGLNEYVKIHTHNQQYTTLASLKDIAAKLPAGKFMRIHKSFIVAKKLIASYNAQQLLLSNNKQLPIGRMYKNDFIQAMKS